MKKLFKSIAFLSFVLITGNFNPIFSQNQLVSKLNDKSNMVISNQQINQYLDKFEDFTQINEMTISEHENQNYLLAKDENGWVFIMPLKVKKDKLVLDKRKIINACQNEQLSLEIFRIEGQQIVGCENCNHKIIKK